MAEYSWQELREKVNGFVKRYNEVPESDKETRRRIDKVLETFMTDNHLTDIKRRYWKYYYERYTRKS